MRECMNAFLTSILHLLLHVLSGIPAKVITSIAESLPDLVAKAEDPAVSGWQKLENVVTAALPLVPAQYQSDAKAVLTVLTSVEVLVQRTAKK